VRLFVEDRAAQRIAEALFRPYEVLVENSMTSSSALADAVFSLLEHPDRPVAVLQNADTEDPIAIDESRQAALRILGRADPRENWCFAFAFPDLEAWAVTDQRIRQDLEAYMQGKATYYDRALRIVELTRKKPFDPIELLRQSPDFRGLVEFIQKHSAAPAGEKAAATA
jgi:hypothetical protein